MTNLKSANIGFNKFCGPAVLSILTGKNTDECASVISSISGQYTVTGVNLDVLLTAAQRLGFDSKSVLSDTSLYSTLVQLAGSDGIYIVTIIGHFVVIEVKERKIYFCDNHTKEPIPAASSARLQQRVVMTHKVWKRADYVEPLPKPTPKLIMKDINVIISNSSIFIDRVSLYDNPDDNKKEQVGMIKAADGDELNLIIERLREELADE